MHVLIAAVSSATSPSGICRHAANLARSLAASHDISRVTLLVGSWQERYFNIAFGLQNTGVYVVPMNIPRNAIARNLWYLGKLPHIANAYPADIVHLSFPVPIVRTKFSCPVVSSIHDLYPYDIPANFGRGRSVVNRTFLRRCLRESDFLVCVSDFTLSRLQLTFGLAQHGKAARIYPFVSVDSTHMKEPALPGLRAHPFILTVAQHRRNKNLPLLLSAFADLKRRHGHRELKLLVVGGHGPETASLRRLTRELRIDDSVVFTRGLIDVELCWLYKHCALFVAPSSIEGFGHPVCEALQCGSHVLCSDIPAFREVGGAACHYFDVLSESPTTVLSDAMAEALAQPRPVVRRENPFSSERTAAQHVSLYSALTSFPPKAALENIHHALIRNDALQSRAAS